MMNRSRLAEQVAPWALMIVAALAWWGGARLVHWSGVRSLLPAAPTEVASAAPGAAPDARPAAGVPAPRPVPDPLPAMAIRPEEATSGSPVRSAAGLPVITFQDITDLRARRLTVPVQGVLVETLVPSYRDARDGSRHHEAMDILSGRGTPVVAVEDGRIARLFESQRGGLTVYQFDPTEQFAYYYAHLDGYAAGLVEGAAVHRGQLLGYVGTTGNAPENVPHLHFAIFKLGPHRRWWEGTPLDPYVIWR